MGVVVSVDGNYGSKMVNGSVEWRKVEDTLVVK